MDSETAKKIIIIRNCLLNKDYEEAWHQLYLIADPELKKFNPWEELEKLASTSSNNKYTASQATPKSCPDFAQGKACKHGLRKSCGISCSCVPKEA